MLKIESRDLVYPDLCCGNLVMTLRKLDYVLYLNARRWLDMHKIVIDSEDAPMLGKEAIIDITGRDMPVVIRGKRVGPLAKSQLLSTYVKPEKGSVRGGAKKKPSEKPGQESLAEVKEPATNPNEQRLIFVIAPESNPFSKKEDIAKVTWGIPMDGSAEVIIASSIIAPQLADFPFIRNIKHEFLSNNPLDSSSCSRISVIRDPEQIKAEVLWDSVAEDLSGIAKMRISLDPYTFWLDTRPGDVVSYDMNAEDTCTSAEYRHVTK